MWSMLRHVTSAKLFSFLGRIYFLFRRCEWIWELSDTYLAIFLFRDFYLDWGNEIFVYELLIEKGPFPCNLESHRAGRFKSCTYVYVVGRPPLLYNRGP